MSISAIKMIHKYMDRWSWRESFGQKSILKQEESSISRSNQIILFYRPRDCQRTFRERSLFAKSNTKKGTYSSCGLHRFQRGLWSQRTLECFWIWKWLWKY